MKKKNTGSVRIGGLTVDEWDKLWVPIPGTFNPELGVFYGHAGLIGFRYGDEISYIGRAVQIRRGGIVTRLRDFVNKPGTATGHYGARMVRKHLDEIEVLILSTGSDWNAVSLARLLRPRMIEKYAPRWNVWHPEKH